MATRTDLWPAALDVDVPEALSAIRRQVEAALEGLLEGELRALPAEPAEVLRHAVLAPGKRLRPLLLVAAYRAAGGVHPAISTVACSVELVHTYSLIHDDLPCMDDDVLRRGRPALHVRFGVDRAVLAGASLLPLAVRAICAGGAEMGLDDARLRRLVGTLTAAAGGSGMAGGQLRDLRAEGRRVHPRELREIHRGKTAELMAASVVMGGIAAGAPQPLLARLRAFGSRLGLAFQAVDDLLDARGDARTLGKPVGRDRALRKASAPSVLGEGGTLQLARRLAREARGQLRGVSGAGLLLALADAAVDRSR